ncbi:MAG TPA: hypothetical protein PKD24_14770 [Pyrinomonadaceae bacterium]|nr:hypothetical protein [Pyrinomonadaceae bacterium]
MNSRTKTGPEFLRSAALISLLAILLLACEARVRNLPVDSPTSNVEIRTHEEIQTLISPTPEQPFNIHSKIGIVDVRNNRTSCLRTKNGNLAEKTPVSIIISLDELPQRILSASVEKKLGESCARYASESGDTNPGDNFFYSLILNDYEGEEIVYDNGIAVIQPERPVLLEDSFAVVDLNDDGKLEYFRRCTGFEGAHFTIWTGKPLKGKRIWHSFYYVDYDTEPNCKEKDWKGTENWVD